MKIIFLLNLIFLSTFCYGSNIGVCGHPIFIEREKIIDNLILKLKNNEPVQKIILNNFGYLGIENLIRYREQKLIDIYTNLINSTNFYVVLKSVYGLGNLDLTNNFVTEKLIKLLRVTDNLILKDTIISTLTKMNDKRVYNELKSLYSIETNIYIKNSLAWSLKILNGEYSLLFPDFNYGIEQGLLKKYKYYKVGDSIPDYKETYSLIYPYEKDFPTADKFIEPVIDYEKEFIIKGERISFGAGSEIVHTGDDCAWFREGSSVFAIGNGIVRLVHHSPDWGFLILIEHKLPDGDYICSIYGHLSKNIYLKAGDIVNIGEKIGEIGLSYSVENGGYGAHLHFGIAKGRWLKPDINLGQNIILKTTGNEPEKVKEYKINLNSVEILYENGIKIIVEQNSKQISNFLFWLKGYSFSQDLDRIWLDPKRFLNEFK